ncbi:helix-turn-helix domain-containing protein [Cohnella fermenti]|uniref:Helix-turn-helix domain-containing protein n=1 Tax=Cohnella fermenti TaxID=2565925 RepID=A0A4S4BPD4_9BACL|nr:AraC family transcriptional regulator [Cohnella fermenti]THF76222.1 helix-turn-helix domain-containing protein [Cohnella fermenti]
MLRNRSELATTSGRLAETDIYVREAHRYIYRGGYHEETRVGYTYAFHLVARGQGTIAVNGHPHPVGVGSLVFIRPGEPHSFHLSAPSAPLEAYNIYCDLWGKPEPLFSRFSFQTDRPDPQLMPPQAKCPELDELPAHARIPAHSPLTDWFARICGWHGQEDDNAEALVSTLMKAWLLQAHRELRTEASADRRIARLLERMEWEPEARFSHEEMSRECGLEKSRFYALFKSATGMTPKACQLRLKMKKAAALLLESDQSVTRISEQLGYDTVHYFSKQFSDFHGQSPTKYRSLRRGGGF